MNSSLVIVDLDHTLIYGSYTHEPGLDKLAQFNELLAIYKRPGVDSFVQQLQHVDTVVYSAAKEDYVHTIVDRLKVPAREILHRNHCKRSSSTDSYHKWLRRTWVRQYDQILIIDDSPHLWSKQAREIAHWMIPPKFMGDVHDNYLDSICLSSYHNL